MHTRPWVLAAVALLATSVLLAHDLFLKLDTDRSPGITERFGIRGIPTLLAFRDGREIGRHVGLAQRAQLEALLDG